MIEMLILGFLAEGPAHGYELRKKISQLHGHARTISEGTMYPAISRLLRADKIEVETPADDQATGRRTLRITALGTARLEEMLRAAEGHDITDLGRFFVVLAFLSQLPDAAERRAVLQRRLDYLTEPSSFFYDGTTPLQAADLSDPYRRGILVTARGARQAETAWLREQLESPMPSTASRPVTTDGSAGTRARTP